METQETYFVHEYDMRNLQCIFQGEKHGILKSWNLVESCGILWNPMESDGIHEISTESCGSQSKSPWMYTIAGNFIKIHK